MTTPKEPLGQRHSKAMIGGTGLVGVLAAILAVLQTGVTALGFDWGAWGVDLTKLIVPAIAIPALYYGRWLFQNKIPKPVVVLVGVAVGTFGEYIHSLATSGDFHMIVALALAGVADICYTLAKEAVGDPA